MIIILVLGLGFVATLAYIFFVLKGQRGSYESTSVNREKEARIKAQGELSQALTRTTELNAQLKSIEKEKEALKGKVIKFETTEEQRKSEHGRHLEQADKQRESFEKQEQRVSQEEREQREVAEANRDRIWSEHEAKVISKMVELCQLPEYQMPMFTNKNIPSELINQFGTRFKPDVLIRLENQFVVFDAKHSKAEQLSAYISNQVKKFASKADSSQLIYPAVFFVVPTLSLANLKQTIFTESGYRIYVVSIESLPVLLAMFKRVEGYALADKLDPAERENIVTSLASMYQHINFRNASDLLLTRMGLETLRKNELRLNPEMQEEVRQVLSQQRPPNFSSSETKKLMSNPDNQETAMGEMISPKTMISQEDFDAPEFITSGKVKKSKK